MDPVRLRGLTPDEFERLCLEVAKRALSTDTVSRRGSISDPDQGVDIEATVGSSTVAIQCKTGKLTSLALRETLRRLVRYPQRVDRFILMCAQHPMPAALDEFRQWASQAEILSGPIMVIELWDPDQIAEQLDLYPEVLGKITQEPRGTVFAVPISRSSYFVGREIALEQLDQLMRGQGSAAIAVSIVGPGGCGKTTLAAEYAYRWKAHYPGGVYWMNGQDDLIAQCERFAVLSEASHSNDRRATAARAFLHALRSGERALVIIDNLDRPNLINEPLIDGLSLADCGCKILITSRFSGLLAKGVSILSLHTLSEYDSLTLLARISNRRGLEDPTNPDHEAALELCKRLGGLPLAIQMAGSYLAVSTETSVDAYLTSLKAHGAVTGIDESEADTLHIIRTSEGSITASLRMAYDSIRDEEARRLFQILCFLPEEQSINSEMVALLLGHIGNGAARKALAWLKNSGFAGVDQSGRIRIHPLARSFGSSILSPNDLSQLALTVGESVKKELLRIMVTKEEHVPEAKPLPRVFLCYAGPDQDKIEHLYNRLHKDGFLPWMDKKSLLPGQDWSLEIRRAIETADYFLACISRHFQRRTYGHKEIKLALNVLDMMPEGTIFLIPLRLEECQIDDRLASRQWVDLFDANGYDLLIKALRTKI